MAAATAAGTVPLDDLFTFLLDLLDDPSLQPLLCGCRALDTLASLVYRILVRLRWAIQLVRALPGLALALPLPAQAVAAGSLH